MEKPIEKILDLCLEKIKEGIPTEEVLRQYPDYADELKELLTIAKHIKDSPSPVPSDKGVASALLNLARHFNCKGKSPTKQDYPDCSIFRSLLGQGH